MESVGKVRAAADLAFSKGESEKAAQLWGKVIELEPENEQNYYKRFRVYLRMQKHKEALRDLDSALTIKPSYEQALAQRAKLGLRLGRCSESVQNFRDLAKLNPEHKDIKDSALLKDASTCASMAQEVYIYINCCLMDLILKL